MPESVDFISFVDKYFWAVAILLSFVNVAIMWQRTGPHRQRDPSTADGYRTLVRGVLFWWNIPWLIMGAGILSGGAKSLFEFIEFPSRNPFVIAFNASLVLLWILGTFWLFARDGAEYLSRHPDFFSIGSGNPAVIKWFWVILPIGCLILFTVL